MGGITKIIRKGVKTIEDVFETGIEIGEESVYLLKEVVGLVPIIKDLTILTLQITNSTVRLAGLVFYWADIMVLLTPGISLIIGGTILGNIFENKEDKNNKILDMLGIKRLR